jgi:protein-disulfide isomerase
MLVWCVTSCSPSPGGVIANTGRTPTASPAQPQASVTQRVTARPQSTATAPRATAAPASAVSPVDYAGVPMGFTPDGYAAMGDPKAPVTLEEYTDFLCPFCGRHVLQTVPTLIQKYVATGQLYYVFHDLPLAGLHPTSERGHVAARCVAAQGAPLFWKMHDELFGAQAEWGELPDPTEYLASAAKKAGADMGAYQQCLSAGDTVTAVQQSIAAGEALGFSGTPSFRFLANKSGKAYTLVGAVPAAVFSSWIDALLQGQDPPPTPTPPQPQVPLWASAKGLAPDPNRPGFDVAGSPYKGNPQAKVVVIEFSDFGCATCLQHQQEVQPSIDKAYVESGKLLWVFKYLPATDPAQAAARAAVCAGEQGRFWEMHDLLFKTQAQWAVAQPEPVLQQLAGQLSLNAEQFGACLSSQKAKDQVAADVADAQQATQSAPTFIFMIGNRGGVLEGSRSLAEFTNIIDSVLQQAGAAAP